MDSAKRTDEMPSIKTVLDERFEIESVFLETATAITYRARHLLLDKPVLVKVLREQFQGNASFQRFQREIAALSALSHPNIVTAFATGIYQNHPYLVSEEIQGETLAAVLTKAGNDPKHCELNAEMKRSILLQICDALAHLHSHDIVHRDLRPETIVISDDRQFAKLTDFDFAKFSSNKNELRVTQTGEMIGSASYASPEQLSGGNVDSRSDLFSLGCLTYELFTGEPPLKEGIPFAVSPEQSAATNPKLSAQLQRCVNRLLQKKPSDRYASAQDVKSEIGALKSIAEPRTDSKTKPVLIASVAAVLVIAVVVYGFLNAKKVSPSATQLAPQTAPPRTRTADAQFRQLVYEATSASKNDNVQKVHELTPEILQLIPQIKPTEENISKLGDYVQQLKEKRSYDLGLDSSVKGIEFAKRCNSPAQLAYFSTSQIECLDSLGQQDEAINKAETFLKSPLARRYPTNIFVLHGKADLAGAIFHKLMDDQPDSKKVKELETRAQSLISELKELPHRSNDELASINAGLVKDFDFYQKFKSMVPRPNQNQTTAERLEAFAQAANRHLDVIQRANLAEERQKPEYDDRRAKASLAQALKSLEQNTTMIEKGYLYNISRAHEAVQQISLGNLEEGKKLADYTSQYIINRQYSKILSNVMGDMAQAYTSRNQIEEALSILNSKILYEKKNPKRDTTAALLDTLTQKGVLLERKGNFDDAIKTLSEALDTKFATALPIYKDSLSAKLHLAICLRKKADVQSGKRAMKLLKQIDQTQTLLDSSNAEKQDTIDSQKVVDEARSILRGSQQDKAMKDPTK